MATEKRLIDANSAVEYCRNRWGMNSMTEKFLNAQPTVDAVEVVHGRWEWRHTNEYTEILTCSVCSKTEGADERHKYCPNCGAKMDLEVET